MQRTVFLPNFLLFALVGLFIQIQNSQAEYIQLADNTHTAKESEVKRVSQLSCSEVIDIVKESECADLVRPMLKGAHITTGLAWQNLNVSVKDKDTNKVDGKIVDHAVPSPFISLDLQPSYFDDSQFGWGVGFNYGDAYALEQEISRTGGTEKVDLGSYMTSTMITLTPHGFYQFGRPTGDKYFRAGLGMALGYASVRGNVYLTEDKSNQACYDAGTHVVNKTGASTIKARLELVKNSCEQESFNEGRFGAGAYIFLQGQYKRWQSSINLFNIALQKKDRRLEPSLISFQIAYVIPI